VVARLRQKDPRAYLYIVAKVVARIAPLADADDADDAAAANAEVGRAKTRDQLLDVSRARGGARAVDGFTRLLALLDEFPELKGVVYR
jgi:hypothetical protein